ncbi:MAG: HD domain-containing protein [Actinomycetota bacterium]|nr:HD domain-containing protein [Actinomycetota bacterium]
MQLKRQFRVILLQIISILFGLIIFGMFLPKLIAVHWFSTLLFGIAVALSRLLDIQLPQGGKLHIDTAVIIASILLFPLQDVLAIITIGMLGSMLLKQIRLGFGNVAYQLSLKINTAFLSANLFYLAGGRPGAVEPFFGIMAILILCATYSIIDQSFDRLATASNRGTPFVPALLSAIHFLGPVYLSLSSLGVLLAVMYGGMKYWSLILFFLPLLVTRLSFKSFLDIRNVYRKTIEALANAIEAQNPSRHGHGRRVANYAIDIAKELGIHGRDLELIGYAALLHDIGMLGVDEDSLDHLLEQASTRDGAAPHALIGAEIVEQVDFLKDAADMIRKHHYPVKRKRASEKIPIGARIINVASYFDKLTKTDIPDERLTAYQAISRIKKEQGITFDPRVVRALISVMRKQGKLMDFVS